MRICVATAITLHALSMYSLVAEQHRVLAYS
jgi:hypothetical protein